MAKKFSQFPSASSIGLGDSVVGLKDGENSRFSFATVFSYIQSLFVPTSRKVNNKTLSSDITLDASDVGAVETDAVGVADGVASLDSTGKVPSSQLPPISSDAEDITYDPTTSGLSATNVQDAIDEVVTDLDGKQAKITANGILKGDGAGGVSAATAGTDYQAPLTFDNTPTANSTNPVQSGGVYTDVRTRVPNYGKGKNLLRNWYFVGGGTGRGVFPVNQRGATTLNVGSTYFVDGWVTRNTTGSVAISSSGLSITTPSGLGARFALFQHIQLGNYASKPLTLSVLDSTKVYSATVDSLSITGTSTRVIQISLDDGGLAELYVSTSDCYISLSSGIGKTSVYRAIKFELGTEQTLAHQENGVWVLNEIPDYEYELYRCITSTADPSDTYANKSLATEQQLAYVETGATASRAYSVGEYFCWNGLLYRVTAAISSGAAFTPGTNCESTTISNALFGPMRRDVLYNPGSSVSVATDTTLTLSDDYRHYKFVQMILYNSASSMNTTRTILTIPTNDLESRVHYPLAFGSTVGSVSIGVGSTAGTTIRFYASAISPLTLRYIFGLA